MILLKKLLTSVSNGETLVASGSTSSLEALLDVFSEIRT